MEFYERVRISPLYNRNPSAPAFAAAPLSGVAEGWYCLFPIFERNWRLSVKSWLFLGIAIVAEVVATTGLKASEGFSKFWPSMLVIAGYIVAFYFLSITLKEIPVGLAYAIWAGLGIVLVAFIGWLVYGQSLDAASVIGMALIIAGVAVINVFSKTAVH